MEEVKSKTLLTANTRQLKTKLSKQLQAVDGDPSDMTERHRSSPQLSLSAPPGSSSLRAYPLLSVITRQPPHLPQVSSPGGVPASHLPLLSPQHPQCSEPSPSQTPLSISSESETERSTPRLKKPRRSRTIFTEVQLMGLEKKFQKQKYLSTPDRSVL